LAIVGVPRGAPEPSKEGLSVLARAVKELPVQEQKKMIVGALMDFPQSPDDSDQSEANPPTGRSTRR
jgi:hypothetical protein